MKDGLIFLTRDQFVKNSFKVSEQVKWS